MHSSLCTTFKIMARSVRIGQSPGRPEYTQSAKKTTAATACGIHGTVRTAQSSDCCRPPDRGVQLPADRGALRTAFHDDWKNCARGEDGQAGAIKLDLTLFSHSPNARRFPLHVTGRRRPGRVRPRPLVIREPGFSRMPSVVSRRADSVLFRSARRSCSPGLPGPP